MHPSVPSTLMLILLFFVLSSFVFVIVWRLVFFLFLPDVQQLKAQNFSGKQSLEEELLERKRLQLLERQRKQEEEEVRTRTLRWESVNIMNSVGVSEVW